jgi:acetolactate synthase-1/2/3 large subunit
MNVAELLVRCLESEGVRYVFGVPGEENEALLFALDASSIRFVPTRHEQGAAFIANVWGRLTGESGVCLSTLGPGATNLLTGVADAQLDKAPLVAITAQGALGRLHHESHQAINVVRMFQPITKWSGSITTPNTVAEMVRKAFKLAEAEKPGATHIELPEDVASEQVPVEPGIKPLLPRVVRRPAADHKAVAAALSLLRAAKRPLVLAGNGAIRKLASKHLTQFVTTHDLPVVATFMGKGAVSDLLPQSLLAVGLGFRDYVNEAIDASDLIMTVGYDIAELPPERFNPRTDKRIIHVDFEPAEVYTHYEVDVEVVGDISGTLWELQRQLADSGLDNERGWWKPVRDKILADIARERRPDDARPTIPAALLLLRELLPERGRLISDVGSHKLWIARNFPACEPGSVLISNGLASMGIELPGAIAAALQDPSRPVVAAMGDGGFLMNVQELETATRLGVHFVALVFNDNDYGLISWKQRRHRQRAVSTRITNPDFLALASSFGVRGARAANMGELRPILQQAIGDDAIWLIEVPVDPSVNDALATRLAAPSDPLAF